MEFGKYKVFHRTWWKQNPSWPNGLEPCGGKKRKIGFANTEAAARDMCMVWNAKHKSGPLSDKAEYEQETKP